MRRHDFQELTRVRLREARALLGAGCSDGSYYLAGLSVECALKACISRKSRRYDFPDLEAVKAAWVHNLESLVKAAGLWVALETEQKARPIFSRNWALVKDWRVESRYQRRSRVEAAALYAAITSRREGVIPWIRRHW